MNPLFTDPPANATISSQGWVWRLINGVAWMTTPYAGISMQYYGMATLAVAFGVSTPEYWIDPYGKWVDAYTVRNFWGYVFLLIIVVTNGDNLFLCHIGKSGTK